MNLFFYFLCKDEKYLYPKSEDRFIALHRPESFPQHLLRHDEPCPGVGGESVHLLQDITVARHGLTHLLPRHRLRPGRLQGPPHLSGEPGLHLGYGEPAARVRTPDRTDQLHGGPGVGAEHFADIIRQFLSYWIILLAGGTLAVKPVVFLGNVERIQI